MRAHRARVVECRRDDEPGQPMTSHVGCDGHSAGAHHLRIAGTDPNREPEQACVGHKPVAAPGTEVLFLGQPGQAGRGNTEGVVAAENLVLVRFRVPGGAALRPVRQRVVLRHPHMMLFLGGVAKRSAAARTVLPSPVTRHPSPATLHPLINRADIAVVRASTRM